MCILNFLPWEEPIEFPLPRGRPHIAWVLPVNLSDLGGRLQAFTDTAPQTTMLRLCHRFRDSALSRMPQELLEQIIDNAERAAEAKCQSEWYRDSVCWQGTCLAEDHYHVYGEYVEKLWQKIFVAKHYGKIFKTDILNPSEAEKVEMVRDAAMCNPNIHADEEGYALHHDARFRWLERVCLCPGTATTGTQNGGNFVAMNHVLKSRFGLEAIILHEVLSKQMYEFLPNAKDLEDHSFYTACYLTLAPVSVTSAPVSGVAATSQVRTFDSGSVHTAFRQVLDPSSLSISDKQRFRFTRAMKELGLKPHYHLSELEPHVVHPIQDKALAALCCCRDSQCPGACPDIHSWDRPSCLESVIESESRELAKDSWPKLMNIAASDAVMPNDWDE